MCERCCRVPVPLSSLSLHAHYLIIISFEGPGWLRRKAAGAGHDNGVVDSTQQLRRREEAKRCSRALREKQLASRVTETKPVCSHRVQTGLLCAAWFRILSEALGTEGLTEAQFTSANDFHFTASDGIKYLRNFVSQDASDRCKQTQFHSFVHC